MFRVFKITPLTETTKGKLSFVQSNSKEDALRLYATMHGIQANGVEYIKDNEYCLKCEDDAIIYNVEDN